MANEKENEKLSSSKRKDREANKLIVTLQERVYNYHILNSGSIVCNIVVEESRIRSILQ